MARKSERGNRIREICEYIWPLIPEAATYDYINAPIDIKTILYYHVSAMLPMLEQRDDRIDRMQEKLCSLIEVMSFMAAERYNDSTLFLTVDNISKKVGVSNPLLPVE